MGFLPPLGKLQYVLAVARDLHFREAAERLHVAQPNISLQIREYGEELGFEIFLRDRHFVSLTKAGRSFVLDVEVILARLENDFKNAVTLSGPRIIAELPAPDRGADRDWEVIDDKSRRRAYRRFHLSNVDRWQRSRVISDCHPRRKAQGVYVG